MIDNYTCPFCNRNPEGYRRVYENSDFWVAIHEETKTPTAVLKEHRAKIYPDELNEMKRVCNNLFNMDFCVIDVQDKQHYHFQLLEREVPTIEKDEGDSNEQRLEEEKKKTTKKRKS